MLASTCIIYPPGKHTRYITKVTNDHIPYFALILMMILKNDLVWRFPKRAVWVDVEMLGHKYTIQYTVKMAHATTYAKIASMPLQSRVWKVGAELI